MADEKKEVVLKITFDTKEAEKRQAEIISLLAEQNKGYKELQASVNKAGKATAEEANQLVAYRSSIAALNTEQRVLTKNIGLHNIQLEYAQDATISMRARLSEATQELIKHSKAEIDASESLSALREEAKGLSDQLKGNESSWGDNRRNVGNYANSIAGLELKLKDLTATLRVTDANSPEFEKTQKAVNDTTEQLGILSGKFDEFGNREPKNPQKRELDAIADATTGAISAFEIYNLTLGDAEDQSAAQARALQAMAVGQHLRNLQIGIANAGEAAGVIITKASSFAIGAKTKALGLATVATRVWNTVLRLNPIGLVVTAVLAAVAAVTFLTNKFNLAAKAGEFFNTHFSGVVKWLEKTGEALGLVDSATEKALATMERRKEAAAEEIRVLEAAEGAERAIYEKRRKLLVEEVTLLNKLHKEKGELSAEQVKQRRTLLNDLTILDLEEKKRQDDGMKDLAKKREAAAKKALDAAKKELAEAEKRTKELLEISKERIERELGHAKEGSIKQLNLRQALIRKQLEIDNVGAEISRARRVANQEKANDEILKVNEEYFKKMEVQHREFAAKVLGPLTKEDVERQIEATGKRLEAQRNLNTAIADSENELQRTKVDAMSAGVDALKGFFGEQSEAAKAFYLVQKGFAIADIILNLQAEIAKIASANAILGPAGIPLTIAQSLAAKIRAGIGIATIAATTIQEFSMAKGGIVNGPSHAAGGVRGTGSFANVEVEGGEAVINKNSTARFAPFLSAINVAGGGRPLMPSRYNAAGGVIPHAPVPYDHFAAAARYSLSGGGGMNIDYDKLANAMAKRPSVVTVSDINRASNKVEVKRTKTDI